MQSYRNLRFFMGKNKVMAVAFGRGDDDEYQDNMAPLGKVNRLQRLCSTDDANASC